MPHLPASGWYTDPDDSLRQRWWDGARWTQHSAPLPDAPAASAAPASSRAESRLNSPARPTWRPTRLSWVSGAIALLIALISSVSGGIGGFLIVAAIYAATSAFWTLATGRPGWLNLRGRRSIGKIVIAASAAVFVIAAIAIPHGSTPSAASDTRPISSASEPAASSSPKPTPTPTPTPTPVTKPVAEYLGQPAADAERALLATGFKVEKAASDGSAPSDWTGWTVVEQRPTSGTVIPAGTTVVLILGPPAPVVETAPEPEPEQSEPVAPDPAPEEEAPAPDPEPQAPEPAPSDVITPGAFCADADVGVTATAANGRSYTCGGKGPDANGHYHWNAP